MPNLQGLELPGPGAMQLSTMPALLRAVPASLLRVTIGRCELGDAGRWRSSSRGYRYGAAG